VMLLIEDLYKDIFPAAWKPSFTRMYKEILVW
jgi:hypothetical protein